MKSLREQYPYTVSASEKEAMQLYIKIMRMAGATTTRIHQDLPESFTLTQIAVLDALYHLGPLCQKDLAKKLLTTSGNLTLVISNLSRKGWVLKTRHGKDRRFATITLTEEGAKVFSDFMPNHARRIAETFEELTEEEKALFQSTFRKLGQRCAEPDPTKESGLRSDSMDKINFPEGKSFAPKEAFGNLFGSIR